MRIGELAALAGVSTRAVRHYHHLGLLPEPERLANGYRLYTLRDAVTLSRIRRLSELGLSLEEIRDVLADQQGRELREVLTELDADLERQEAEIRERRARLAALLAHEDPQPDDALSPDMARILGRLPQGGGGMAARDRELLALLDTSMPADRRSGFVDPVLALPESDPEFHARVMRVYAELDAFADVVPDEDDPKVEELAWRLIELTPRELIPEGDLQMPGEDDPFVRAFFADLSPGQAVVIRRVMKLLSKP
ncbi:MerR family transcriptional regulator [Nonomuraea endophytica]|uniref:DNA-binding transcriptional MerR regulator n=1 Tax=Nonomuraea endophytica TaxID=714136 RepID=A0A7W8A8D1_9ACTN|nr:MerR family transcriptional regulator [Nonomuraea endophytica]MBB5081435.1 DNA-binding transcriptional MerR regulator [Nonomuraea endophytica]